jgi:hypothetical protein
MVPYTRRGVGLVWAVTCMSMLIAIGALTLDVMRWQMVKTELRRAADAAARAGAGALPGGVMQAESAARDIAMQNAVDARSLNSGQIDAEAGHWDTATRTFFVNPPTGRNFNAFRVTLHRTNARGGGVESVLGRLVGLGNLNARSEAIAMASAGVNVNHDIDGRVNPFLAGMPVGSVASQNNPHRNADVLGGVPMPIVPGQTLTFDSISGTVRHDPNLARYDPDGNLGAVGHNHNPTNGDIYGTGYYNENGIADMTAPINALVGVFLTDDAPNLSAAPSENLNFSTAESRDFATLKPKVKQIFFIGDGLRNDGVTQQQFEVPPGATRLVLATWDFYEWNNNAGVRTVRVSRPSQVTLVK